MLLRASGEFAGKNYDLKAVMSDKGLVNSIPHGKLLMALVQAVFDDEIKNLEKARSEVRSEMGDSAFVDACAIIASFSAVVKIADGTGIPLEDYKEEASRDIRKSLSIDKFLT